MTIYIQFPRANHRYATGQSVISKIFGLTIVNSYESMSKKKKINNHTLDENDNTQDNIYICFPIKIKIVMTF